MDLANSVLSRSFTSTATNTIAAVNPGPSWSNLRKASPTTGTFHDSNDKTLRLPNELRAALLQLSLPEIDTLATHPVPGVCRSYVARLYALRQVSASWRDIIDGTPTLWAIVSSTTPIQIVAACLSRSETCPLLIHYGGYEARKMMTMKERESFLQFFDLTNPHRHRWAVAWLEIVPDFAVNFFNAATPLLHTVKLTSIGSRATLQPNPTTPSDTAFGNEIKLLHNVELRGGPANWGLGHFRGLRSWSMMELLGDGLTTQHILGVLQENPLLEVLKMDELNIRIHPDDTTLLTPISLPRLTSIILRGLKGDAVDHILRRIRTPIDMIHRFSIAVWSWGRLDPIKLLTDVLASWSPAFQRAHRSSGGSKFCLSALGTFYWIANGIQTEFSLYFFGLKAVTGVQWMADILSQTDQPGPGTSVECWSTVLESAETMNILGSTEKITRLDAHMRHNEESMQILLQALSDPTRPAFPWLETLNLDGLRWGMGSIVNMIQARFTDNRTGVARLPKLRIEVVSLNPEWWFGNQPIKRQIIDLNTVKTISALNGVERLHFGTLSGQDGMLGVVWSDELGEPTWG